MIDPEREGIIHRAWRRQERIAVLRRRRAIAELRRQIDFQTMWADPRRRATYDQRRRLFYQHRPHLYEPVPKALGRRELLASLATLLTTPVLAQAPNSFSTSWEAQNRAELPYPRRLTQPSHASMSGISASLLILTGGGGDDDVPIQAAINHAASIGGAMVYLGPGSILLTGSQAINSPALS